MARGGGIDVSCWSCLGYGGMRGYAHSMRAYRGTNWHGVEGTKEVVRACWSQPTPGQGKARSDSDPARHDQAAGDAARDARPCRDVPQPPPDQPAARHSTTTSGTA